MDCLSPVTERVTLWKKYAVTAFFGPVTMTDMDSVRVMARHDFALIGAHFYIHLGERTMKRHCKFSDNKIEAALWKISKLTCWTLLLLLGVLLFDTVPWVLVIVGVLGIPLFINVKINEDDENGDD